MTVKLSFFFFYYKSITGFEQCPTISFKRVNLKTKKKTLQLSVEYK